MPGLPDGHEPKTAGITSQRPGIQIGARYEPANEMFDVGGDWYDTINLSDGRIGLVVGDVVGHGIDAMTSMGRLRRAFVAKALENDDPAEVLSEVNELVSEPDGAGYATVFYAIVDTQNGAIQYASAGHPPGLLLSSRGEITWLEQGQSGPLFGQPSPHRPLGSASLEPGATMVLYSDGLIERRGESLDVGLAKLERLVIELSERNPEAICDELISRLGLDASREDDVVVLVVKPEPAATRMYRESFRATPDDLSRIRSSIRSWAAQLELSTRTQDDLLIAIGEATANSIRHAYRDSTPGEVEVQIEQVGRYLQIAVSDHGTWLEPSGRSTTPGMGISLIRALTDGYQSESDESGTRVTFRMEFMQRRTGFPAAHLPSRPHGCPSHRGG